MSLTDLYEEYDIPENEGRDYEPKETKDDWDEWGTLSREEMNR